VSAGGESRDVGDLRAAVRDAERRGELLTAFDLAERALAEHPDDPWLRHRAVLALARAGSTEEARRRFHEYRLDEVETEDARALAARIEKDVALAATGGLRRSYAARAAALYRTVFEATGGYYSGINAATLHLLAGQGAAARALAAEVLPLARRATDEPYYAAATEAEAQLVLGDVVAAGDALARAAELASGDFAAVASTRRQLRLVCGALGLDEAILEALPAPEVVHFCGHRITEGPSARLVAADEPAVRERIAAAVAARPIGYAYGSLASGADILWAEALLERGSELHVVLPFCEEEFVRLSVAPAGGEWVERFHRCVDRAAALDYATEDAHLGDDVLFGYASELAMGLAILRARHLEGPVAQLAVWDGRPAAPGAEAGTAVDVERWRRRGLPGVIVPVDRPGEDGVEPPPGSRASRRVVRALLFADVKGFSRLRDDQLPRFCEHVLGAFAAALDASADAVCYRNTWGDGLFVVVSDAEAAAALALDLQAAMDGVDAEAAGLPPWLALRVGAHLGPVYPIDDPVRGTPLFIGSHVSRTARIEPVTPEGSVYVTERFAAALLLATRDTFACDYVGDMPAAKDYGRLRMYRLRPTVAAPARVTKP
jgi:tetratricopeptide repeat protein/adenylate/guanylate cyclase family protein